MSYESSEISVLLQKLVGERDQLIARKKRKYRMILSGQGRAEADEYSTAESDVEICDQLKTVQKSNIEIDAVQEKTAIVQDLLFVIKNANLADALPRAMNLILLTVIMPLTNVHCERVFSRMKHVISTARSCSSSYKLIINFCGI